MAINFPTSLDVFTDPTASDQLNLPSHSGQHTDLNNAVEALEAKVGIDGSAVTSSLDYKVAQRKILQVVSTTKTDTFFTTATTPVDITGLSVTITPTSTASKIVVLVSVSGGISGNSASSAFLNVLRDSTSLVNATSPGSRTVAAFFDGAFGGSTNSRLHLYNMMYVDSPATTSATTYKVTTGSRVATGQAVNRSITDTDNVDHPRGVSTIIVMEVSA